MSAARTSQAKTQARAEAARILDALTGLGAEPVETAILQPAATLLDLYGEDIRARAYVTADPELGEAMLRPDFTVPVALAHMESGRETARYAYAGEVFRRQEDGSDRAREYIQAGIEIFDAGDPAAAEAELFARFAALLEGMPLRRAIGDIGLLSAAVSGLSASDTRKAALMRHLWRPRRFRRLLERFAGRLGAPEGRAALLAAPDPFAGAGPEIGARSRAEVAARLDRLRADAAEPPLPEAEVALLDDLLGIAETAPNAASHLEDLAVDLPALRPAVARFRRRIDALEAAGIDPGTLEFEGSYGRTALEYYDGFVFGFLAEGRADWPPVASGGRYAALTAALGDGRAAPAVGGILRPALTLELGGARC